MWMIFILAGACIIIFNYTARRTKERREDRQDKLKELRQQQLDMLLGKEKEDDISENASTKDPG